GAPGAGSGFWLASAFAPGAGRRQESAIAAREPGPALRRTSTRLGCDWGLARCFGWAPLRTGAVLLQETSARRAAVLVRVGGGMGGGPGRRGRRGGFSGAGGRRCIPRPGRRRYPVPIRVR